MTKKTRANLKINPATSTAWNDGQTLPAEQFLHIADSFPTLDDEYGTAALTTTAQTATGAINEMNAHVAPAAIAFKFNTSTQRVGLWKPTGSYALDVAGGVNATALTINGVPVGSSTDTYWSAVTGGIAYGNKVGVGTGATEPAAPLEVVGNQATSIYSTVTGTIGGATIHRPNRFAATVETDANGGTIRNVWAYTVLTGTHNAATNSGFYAQTYDRRTAGTLTHGWGIVGRYYKEGDGSDVQQMAGLYVDFHVTGTGTVSAAYGIYQNPGVVSAGTVTQAFQADLNEPVVSGTGSVTSNFGIRVGSVTVGTASNYGLYVEQTATTGNHWGIYNEGTNRLYSGGTATIGGALSVGSVTPGTNTLLGELVVYSDSSVGSELITNGAFDSDTTGWTGSSATLASVSGGQSGNALQVTSTSSGNRYATQSVTTVAGRMYRLQFYHKRGSANQALYIGTSAGGSQIAFVNLSLGTNWTLNTRYFQATTTTTHFAFAFSGSPASGSTSLWDEVSVKEVTGGNLQLNGFLTGFGGTSGVKVLGNGNVGIGTTPTSKLTISGLPTSASGLATGDVWNNGGVLTIV